MILIDLISHDLLIKAPFNVSPLHVTHCQLAVRSVKALAEIRFKLNVLAFIPRLFPLCDSVSLKREREEKGDTGNRREMELTNRPLVATELILAGLDGKGQVAFRLQWNAGGGLGKGQEPECSRVGQEKLIKCFLGALPLE